MKARNVSVSVVESDGEIKVWCASFTLKGSLSVNGKVDEAVRKAKQKEIAKVIEAMDFPGGAELPEMSQSEIAAHMSKL